MKWAFWANWQITGCGVVFGLWAPIDRLKDSKEGLQVVVHSPIFGALFSW
jgi:hypothetical protein